jgi:hypothetical protein
MNSNIQYLPIAFLFFLIFTYLGYKIISTFIKLKIYKPTKGKVTKSTLVKAIPYLNPVGQRITIEYKDLNKTIHRVNTGYPLFYFFKQKRMPAGTEINIFYDPDFPDKIITSGEASYIKYLSLISFLCFIFTLIYSMI